jgi:nucleoid DNA-binding protein
VIGHSTWLGNGKGVEFREFGVFNTRLTKQRVGRNPKKPEQEVVIPPRAIVKFKAGKIMKQRVLERTPQLTQNHA